MPRPSSSDLDNIDPSAGKAINEKIHHDLNPEQQHGGLSHNKGQPKRPPHATATGGGGPAATFLTNCAKEHGESLQCIERNYQNRSACEDFFQAYKLCRKEENEKVRAANNSTKNGNSGWFW
ncbi:hypothetical protein IV203_017925 [Nitzschia inconspicua]|uniref:CHCH domain-containing protein n=1 Tax=Nitzschia inconspicua TaxID=303405 RepID=A0A9K3M048_9STRA|nr:hypothetical protein IV203_017925 [Nitzschia inconspicua]